MRTGDFPKWNIYPLTANIRRQNYTPPTSSKRDIYQNLPMSRSNNVFRYNRTKSHQIPRNRHNLTRYPVRLFYSANYRAQTDPPSEKKPGHSPAFSPFHLRTQLPQNLRFNLLGIRQFPGQFRWQIVGQDVFGHADRLVD